MQDANDQSHGLVAYLCAFDFKYFRCDTIYWIKMSADKKQVEVAKTLSLFIYLLFC
jgi:hypothetical protein